MNYADPVDEAAALAELQIEIALRNKKPVQPPSPVCLNGDCGEPSQPGTSYCCPECCADHQREMWAISQRRVA